MHLTKILSVLLLLPPFLAESNKSNRSLDPLTAAEKEFARQQVDSMINNEFVEYLMLITDKSIPLWKREKAVAQAENLFLFENNDPYIEVSKLDENNHLESVNRLKPGVYLQNLCDLPYSSIDMSFKLERAQPIKLVRESYYETTGLYTQTFTGMYGLKIGYHDITIKEITVSLHKIKETDLEGERKIYFNIRLKNISVDDTFR